ncbi:MAG: hypothetical protein ACTHN8_03875, partial [Angustibacter sp.]
MTISSSPAPARTDERGATTYRPTITTNQVRRLGLTLAAGAAVWATVNALTGSSPEQQWALRLGDVTGLGFQIGVFSLLRVQLRTRATGTSRVAVAMLKVEHVLLALASIWSALHAAAPSLWGTPVLNALDLFWPLSMLGMAIIGVKIAVAGRWKGAARVWPLAAESWALVTVPSFVAFGSTVAGYVGAAHLLLGYVGLGLLLARRPEL